MQSYTVERADGSTVKLPFPLKVRQMRGTAYNGVTGEHNEDMAGCNVHTFKQKNTEEKE